MKRRRLHQLSRQITRDVLKVLKGPYKHKSNRQLPGRNKVYIWPFAGAAGSRQDESISCFAVKLKLLDDVPMTYSIDAQAGDEDDETYVWLTISLAREEKAILSTLYHELLGVIRHELEHISGSGLLAMSGPAQKKLYGNEMLDSGKILHDINRRRKLFGSAAQTHSQWGDEEVSRANAAANGSTLFYMTSYDELGPFAIGFYTQARSERVQYQDVVWDYIVYFQKTGKLTHDEALKAFEWFMVWGCDKFPKIKMSSR